MPAQKRRRTTATRAPAKKPARRTSVRKASVPVYTPPARPQHAPFGTMSFEEMQAWLHGTIVKLERKKKREKDYLDRRAARGTHTPTDNAYEDDQVLETELLEFLQQCLLINQVRQP